MTLPILALVALASANLPSERPTDLERGRELYGRHCVACHGRTNQGDGPATQALVAPVPDLSEKGRIRPADPAQLSVVLKGRGSMPAFEPSFHRADARRVLMYMAQVHANPHGALEKPTERGERDDVQTPDGQTPDGQTPEN